MRILGARIAAVLVGLAAAQVFVGCDSGPSSPREGGVENGVYTNAYFGMHVPIPAGWAVASRETQDHFQAMGEAALGDDAATQAAIEASKVHTFNLLHTSQYEIGSPVPFNPNLAIVAERVSHLPGVKHAGDYLYQTTQLLLSSNLPYTQKGETREVELGGDAWYRSDLELSLPTTTVYQSYLGQKRGDFVLVFVISGSSPEEMQQLEDVVANVSFDGGA